MSGLRLATADRHRAIEEVLGLDRPFDLARYRRVLLGFTRFLQAWEPLVVAAFPAASRPWLQGRLRGHLLQRDLAVLGQDPGTAPAMLSLRLGSPAAAFGSLYVIEGSALGGQVISRQLAQRLGIGPDSGGAYFAGAGVRTGALWSEFRQRLESEAGGSAGQRRQAVAAAVQTFDEMIACFQAVLHEPAAA